jgi:hypothetical protein
MDLEAALGQFEKTETNLSRLEAVASEMNSLYPTGIVFGTASPEATRYEQLRRAYEDLLAGLPSLGGFELTATPWAWDEIAQRRVDAIDVDIPEAIAAEAKEANEPDEQLAEYRHRFSKARRKLVRQRARVLMEEVDGIVAEVDETKVPRDGTPIADDESWQRLVNAIGELERLLGTELVHKKGRWADLHRHLGFAQGVDFLDIAESDWQSVRPDIEASLYGELEPLPVDTEDLESLAESGPTGSVSTELQWDILNDEGFERLIFNILLQADGYENPQWLMKTRAPDRGRDLSVDRVISDTLGDIRRERVIVQCRHWLSRSIRPEECAETVAKMSLWEPPLVNALIIVTSGRFTSDAVQWVEGHNQKGSSPRVEMWPDSRLETLLAKRAPLVREFGLRRS